MPRGLLVVAIVLAALAIYWFALREADVPAPPPVDPAPEELPDEADPETEKAPELEAKGAAPKPEAKTETDLPPIPENSVTIKGRVLDERRRPVAGATLAIVTSYEAPPMRTATSGADGRFALAGLVRPTDGVWRGFGVRATHAGRAGLGGTGIWSKSPAEIDVGVITLRAGHAVPVRVRDESGAPIANAHVILEAKVQWTRTVLESVRSDAEGACRFEHMAEQTYRVLAAAEGLGRASATLAVPREEQGPLVLTLGQERDLAVVVTDHETSEPVPGAALLIEEHVRGVLGMAGQIVPYVPRIEGLVTDAEGRARLPGIGTGDPVQVHALKDGYARPGGARMVMASKVVDGEIHIQLKRLREVRWPIAADSDPMPPEGTVLTLEAARGAMTRPLPPTARVEDGYVVAEGCDPGLFHAVALAPDGSYAPIMVMHNSNTGRDAKFQRPKRVVVTVKQADGSPAEGAYVSLRSQGNNVVADPTATDEAGRVVFAVRWAWLLDVMVSPTAAAYSGTPAASINLKEKDGGEVEVTLPAPGRQVELTVMINGEARLPPVYNIGYGSQGPLDLEEDPESGVLRFRLPGGSKGVVRWSFSSQGFLNTTVELPDAGADGIARTSVTLRRGGHCVVRVRAPADGKHQSSLRKAGSKTPGFALPRMGSMPQNLGSKDGWAHIRHGPLEPGTYHAFDSLSRSQSAGVEVKEGEESSVDLDLSTVVVIQGTVEVPDGFEAHKARVHMRGEGLYEDPFEAMRGGAYVRPNGAFEIRVPGATAVRLSVKHPGLIPDPEHGSVMVKDPSAAVRLKLVAGGHALFRLDPPLKQESRGPSSSVNVYLYEGEPAGKATQQLTPSFKDGVFRIAGFKPGAYTLVVDARSHAPTVVPDVKLGDGRTDLGTITLVEGATVRIKLKLKEGEDAPRIFASAHCQGPVSYTRYINSRGEQEVLLEGLGAGTFQLRAQPMRGFGSPGAGTGSGTINETIECDGRTEIVKELDLR